MILKGGTHDMKLGQTIWDIRKERKMTQEEFAQIFHVTRQTVSNWEKAKNYPDLETLISMSDEFNISLDVMLKEDKKFVLWQHWRLVQQAGASLGIMQKTL